MTQPIVVPSAQVLRLPSEKIVAHARETLEDVTRKLGKLRPEQTFERISLETGRENAMQIIAKADAAARHKGWALQQVFIGQERMYRVIGPDGTAYLETVHGSERVDVIIQSEVGALHLKREADAAAVRREQHEQNLIRQAKTAKAVKRAAKKAAKEALGAATDE